MKNDQKILCDTALSAGLDIFPLPVCCQLLAWVEFFGGGNEQCSMDDRVSTALYFAQHRMGLLPGVSPQATELAMLQDYLHDCKLYYDGLISESSWLKELKKRFEINTNYKSKKGRNEQD